MRWGVLSALGLIVLGVGGYALLAWNASRTVASIGRTLLASIDSSSLLVRPTNNGSVLLLGGDTVAVLASVGEVRVGVDGRPTMIVVGHLKPNKEADLPDTASFVAIGSVEVGPVPTVLRMVSARTTTDRPRRGLLVLRPAKDSSELIVYTLR